MAGESAHSRPESSSSQADEERDLPHERELELPHVRDNWEEGEAEREQEDGEGPRGQGHLSSHFISIENERGQQVHSDDTLLGPRSYFNPIALEDEELSSELSVQKVDFIKDIKEIKTRKHSKNTRRRIMEKTGESNIHIHNVSKKRRRFIKDMFTTMVDMRWRYTLLSFTASFFVSWILFAIVWYLISYVHGDFLYYQLQDNDAWKETLGEDFKPCVFAMEEGWASSFLMSVETQHTIGYGFRGTSARCELALILECVQSVVGVIIQACMAGIVFAKLARPKNRTNTVMFSKKAVICQRNGSLYLQFRVGNLRDSTLLESHVRAQLIKHVTTEEGEQIHYHQEELSVGTQLDGETDTALLLWPLIISHKIDEDSPLWQLGPQDLPKAKFEIILILEGIIEATGNTTQARTSYLSDEILWGQRFKNIMSYVENQGVYAVNCASLDEAEKKGDKTPWISAAQIHDMKTRRGRTTSPPGSLSQEDVRVRKSASRLVPGVRGQGGRYSQVAMGSQNMLGPRVRSVSHQGPLSCMVSPPVEEEEDERKESGIGSLTSSQGNNWPVAHQH